ncbi:cytochrome P450 [Zychaea mexicana]|uniref:cytochrome P450 n=1 Tax=Zychaea mexicana TaxID=64656 RepID=UPI0022FE5F77|nr:cytochrome P450 [Zychaea mexicana]KAI9492785.1 cytochrome P450 [Zychaea mexicana]
MAQQVSYGNSSSLLTTASSFLLNQYSSDRKRFLLTAASALAGTWSLWRLIIHYLKRSQTHPTSAPSTVPTVAGALPIVGHSFKINADPLGFIQRCKAQYGPVFKVKLLTQDVYVLTGKLIPELLTASRKTVSFTEGIESIVPIERVMRLSYEHKRTDEELSPRDKHPVVFPIKQNFKPDQIEVFSDRIEKAFLGFLEEELSLKPGEKRQVDTWNILSHAISRISCLCFTGSRVGTNRELVAAMATLTQSVVKAGVLLTVLPGWIANVIVRRYMSIERQLDLLIELLVPLIKGLRSGDIPDDETTFISMVSKLPKSDGSLRSPEHAALWFRAVALASIHTTAHFSTFALHELACRPQLVQDLRQEINELHTRTPETVSHIQPLDSFLREVLRYDIDNLGLHHMTLQDFVLPTGHVIPKRSLIVAAMDEAHNDPALAPPSNKPLSVFDAYRFMNTTDGRQSSTIGMDLISFGLGAHACPGRYFAVNEIKYVLAELIVRYNITTSSGHKRAPNNMAMGMVKFPPKTPIILEGIL